MSRRLLLAVLVLPLMTVPNVVAEPHGGEGAPGSCSNRRKPCTSPTPSSIPALATTSVPDAGLAGIATSEAADGTRLTKVIQLEGQLGAELGVFRLYEDIEADTLTADDVALARLAGAVAISMDVPTGSGWSSIPRGTWDSDLTRWAAELGSLAQDGVDLYLIALTHEPENGPTNRGSARQYVAASRYYVTFMRAEGLAARYVFAPMLFNFGKKMRTWYPGDAFIDVIAPDGYNWNGPTSCDGAKTFAGMFRPVVDAAQARGKLWGVSEFGSTHRSTDPLHQSRWLDAARSFVDANRSRLGYLTYWYNDARCDWTFHRPEAFASFAGML